MSKSKSANSFRQGPPLSDKALLSRCISLTYPRRDLTLAVSVTGPGDTRVIPEMELRMRGKITKRAIEALSPNNSGDAILWDQEVRGFGIRARAGGAKTYILQYRAGTGRRAPLRKLTIGKHGSPWTAVMARTEAKRLLGLVASGQDPAGCRLIERKALTISELCDLYLAEGATHK